MSSLLPEEKLKLQKDLLGVTQACPFDLCNPDDCPLYELRKLPQKERLFWFKALSDEDLTYLASYHYVCLAIKLRAPLSCR